MAKSLAGKAGPRSSLQLHRSPKHSRTLAHGSKKLPARGSVQGFICWPVLPLARHRRQGGARECPEPLSCVTYSVLLEERVEG